MNRYSKCLMTGLALQSVVPFALAQSGGGYDLTWNTFDGGGGTSTGGGFTLSGTAGQPDAGMLTGGEFELIGGFWAVAASSGTGAPTATLIDAVSRKPNPSGPGGVCDITLLPARKSEPRQGGVAEVRVGFDVAPGTPSGSGVTLESATCADPVFAPDASPVSSTVSGNELILTFTPALPNGRTYRISIGPEVTSIGGQYAEVRGLVADVNGDGQVNALDRARVIGAWTGAAGFTCETDVNGSGSTDALDRAIVIGAWTGAANCAP